ncbi:MAG: amidohydrolase [Clostridia bacterium]|nr:amidohydrolase [Clostridia bacterium]
MKTLFKNCTILSKENGEYNEIKNGYLGVDGEVIDYIGAEMPKAEYDVVKDMKGKLLMPGLVNAHGHSAMTILRGVGADLPLDRWLNEAIFPIEAKLTPNDIYVGNQAAMLEMLASGTTCVADMYDFPFAGAKAYAEAGMKANLCRVGLCFDPTLEPSAWERTQECIDFIDVMYGKKASCPELIREAGDELSDVVKEAVKTGRVKADFCLHSEYLTTEKFVKAIAEANAERKVPVHIHVSETVKEHEECIARHGKTPIAYLNEMGIMDNPIYAAHCVWVTDEDLAIMAAKGATIAHNPTSNLKLGSGIARINSALLAGVNVALGTDGVASNNNLNMFEEIHLAALLQKGVLKDPTLVKTSQALDMATISGAKALGRPETGSLEVGKKADIIAIDMDQPHLQPNADTLGLISYAMQGSDVCMTMVDGKILYENGEYLTLDKEKILFDLAEAVKRVC